jgi:hypothetical protein
MRLTAQSAAPRPLPARRRRDRHIADRHAHDLAVVDRAAEGLAAEADVRGGRRKRHVDRVEGIVDCRHAGEDGASVFFQRLSDRVHPNLNLLVPAENCNIDHFVFSDGDFNSLSNKCRGDRQPVRSVSLNKKADSPLLHQFEDLK